MARNLEQIQTFFPDYSVWIVVGNDVPGHYIDKYKSFPFVKIIQKDMTGAALMSHRFFAIDDTSVDIMLVRDADSRFGRRDIWCINHYLNSEYSAFTIRDNWLHQGLIMGGQWGMRKIPGIQIQTLYNEFIKRNPHETVYVSDMTFLKSCLYPLILKSFIVYTNTSNRYNGEMIGDIIVPFQSEYDFCGNAYDFGVDGNEYPTHDKHGNEFKPNVLIDP